MAVEFASKSLLEKARARPDLVRQVLDKAQREGVLTTLESVRSRLDQPLALGYSSAGTVIAVGEGITDIQVGDPVACAGAGYAVHAEVIAVPRNLCVKIPPLSRGAEEPRGGGAREQRSRGAGENAPMHPCTPAPVLSFEEAAFTTLGAIALHSLRLAEPQLGETVAVIGLGLIGLLTVQLAKAAGCRVLGMDPNPDRCRLAEQLGCDATATNSSQFAIRNSQFTDGHGADKVIICAATPSNEPVELAGRIARDRATVVAVGAVGMEIPRKLYYEKELTFRISRSYGPGRYDPEYEEKGHDYPIGYVRWTENRNMQAFLQLLAEGKVDVKPLITHRFPIEEAPKAYDLITGKTGEPFLGVLITYPNQPDLSRKIVLNQCQVSRITHHVSRSGVDRVTIGLLGAGNFAVTTLLPAMKQVPGIEFVGVCTATGLSARHAGDKFGFRYCTTDENEILNDPDINTVVIATRHHLHARQVIAALNAGKHVFCEKPLALTEDQLREIVAAYETRRQGDKGTRRNSPRPPLSLSPPLLVVGFNRRFSPMARQLKAFLADVHEPLVMHYRVNAGYIPPDHWVQGPEQGGGRIIGEVCHFVDFLTFLAGALPVRVHARALPNDGRYRDDNVVITLEFADGSLGTITYVANGDKSFPKERVEVFGGGYVAVLDDFRRLELVCHGRRKVVRSRLRQHKGHRGEWEAFVAALKECGPPPIPFEEIVATTLTTFRILDTLRSGEPVTVDTETFVASALTSEEEHDEQSASISNP
jgi:predicted dehydrogenase/threonine dehydrogenase-like Zn-dependent dehydrogenase